MPPGFAAMPVICIGYSVAHDKFMPFTDDAAYYDVSQAGNTGADALTLHSYLFDGADVSTIQALVDDKRLLPADKATLEAMLQNMNNVLSNAAIV